MASVYPERSKMRAQYESPVMEQTEHPNDQTNFRLEMEGWKAKLNWDCPAGFVKVDHVAGRRKEIRFRSRSI